MILLIDNYDSFSYNLYQMLGSIEPDIKVVRNDALTIDEIRGLYPTCIILSPGPGRPADAGICEDVVRELSDEIPILGVCLGHQAICEAFGGTVTYAGRLMHGKQSETSFDKNCPIFSDVPASTPVGRYHSLSLDKTTLPEDLDITATADDGEVMAVCHRSRPVYGLQFHPESILTPCGKTILETFLKVSRDFKARQHDSSAYGL
ncbi:MAG: aminodeoxychorismate/anthranilate synthase component II [Eubacterium sp.]|nr:aminodeoxychorismate/anthranilate synthase component II [Eubacterium sp.]MBQ7201612.1 aminodeoxychorismate/anthranilate synthase component II [Eubacterium sp.]MBR0118583.1 aminodeoxychorismate/anthranilate synthase component II [Eubacterium sp.]